ncbi:hypothetical protein DFH09DRAFT_1182225 [Mycena vulgaris]|nr:hypothetical protein DFH09DRAFT_1182225 [Mycena vulgaris]
MEDSEMQDIGSIIDADECESPTSTSRVLPSLSPIDQQRISLYILTQRDRPISSLESMKEFLELPDDVATKLRIEELNEQYEDDLDRLYMFQADDYIDDAEDRYYAFEQSFEEDAEELYSLFRREGCDPHLEWDYALTHTTSTYNTRKMQLETPTELEFPQSIDEYRQKRKETQLRVARFLLLETDEQREKMMSEFNWGWRQVAPLKEDFQTNTEFQGELRASIAELNVPDPRRR